MRGVNLPGYGARVVSLDDVCCVDRVRADHLKMAAMKLGSRWLGLTGVGFVVVAFLGLSAAGMTPDINDSTASEILEHWTEVADGELSSALLVLCVPLLLIFGGAVIARHHGSSPFTFSVWSFLFGVGLTVAAVGFISEAAGVAAITDTANSAFSDMVVDQYVGGRRLHMIWVIGLSIALLGAGGMFIPRPGIERVLGGFALAGGIVGLVPEPIGTVGVLVAVLWVLATSIVILVRPVTRLPGKMSTL
jgi:hypothetical protein